VARFPRESGRTLRSAWRHAGGAQAAFVKRGNPVAGFMCRRLRGEYPLRLANPIYNRRQLG